MVKEVSALARFYYLATKTAMLHRLVCQAEVLEKNIISNYSQRLCVVTENLWCAVSTRVFR